MTRREHIVNIIQDICTEAGWTVLETYKPDEMPIGTEITSYAFVVSESEVGAFEDSRGFQVTTSVMLYLDFILNSYGQNYTQKVNELIQAFEDARVTADLTLNRTGTYHEWSSTIPMASNVSGALDDASSRGVIDIMLKVDTYSLPL